ncbi:global transcription regulator sge1 [Plutella xylostella]|uniref:global transcription regulator sge1 n=1 Tax=Plutella xylostella TaxID=51655 RepID=UPI00203301AD|nr:global transcription regulator sge1 [Plutella xylostella]
MMQPILVLLATSCLAAALPAPPPPHPAVVTSDVESQALPVHLRKTAFTHPRLWDILPITSLLHEGESPVYDREAEKVERNSVYNMLTHAGFLSRAHERPPILRNPGRWQSKKHQHHHPQPHEHQPPQHQHQPQYQQPLQHHQPQFHAPPPGHYYQEEAHYEFQHGPQYDHHSSPEHLQYL